MHFKFQPLTRILVSAAAALSPMAVLAAEAAPAAARASTVHKLTAGYTGSHRYVGIADSPKGSGYWLANEHGNVYAKSGAAVYGSPVSRHVHLEHPVVGIASTTAVRGYWLVTSAGRVLAYGKAHNYGGLSRLKLKSPIVAIAVMRDGRGYWLVSASGKVYRFGAARYHGSLAASQSVSAVVAMMVTQGSGGYWLVTAKGGVFPFGDAHSYGSLSGKHLSSRVVGAALSQAAKGYWLVTANGGVVKFGKAKSYGSASRAGHPAAVTSIAATLDGKGYRLLRASGKVLAHGDAVPKVVKPKPAPQPVKSGSDPLKSGSHGYDVSWPQCGESRPSAQDAFVIVGVNDGRPGTTNPCLGGEWRWALTSPHPWVYVNTDNPGYNGSAAYSFGEAAARQDMSTASRLGIKSSIWWLDVETTNVWSGTYSGNTEVILGFIHQLTEDGHPIGIYSTSYQWGKITGGYRLSAPTPEWIAGAPALDATSYCSASEKFAGGATWMIQVATFTLDYDGAC